MKTTSIPTNKFYHFSIPYLLLFLILTGLNTSGSAQIKKKGKVKRKYRDVEQVSKQLPPVFLRGDVYNAQRQPLAGANVSVDGTKKTVFTNENGEFLIENLNTGRARLRISFVGYETKTIDYILSAGENYYKIMLRQNDIHLEPITVNALKYEQQLLDVPEAVSAVSNLSMEQANITDLVTLGEFVPGLIIREQGANRPGFVVRGFSSDEISPSAQPRVSVYANNVPVNRGSAAGIELFDMERVEVLKGPQNTLFGRGAQAGAVHFISKKPTNTTQGYITAGTGSFAQKEFRGAVNVPVLKNKLFVRAAGIYNANDGFVENTFGGTLNGKNTTAGRFSARFIPASNHKFDVVVNYQKDKTPGVAFMSKMFPNTNGKTDIFGGVASLEQGENLETGKDFFDATFTYRYFINEHNYWSVISSYRKSNSNARWDGDGTAAAAIDMAENGNANQFYQEIRGNFSQNSRFNGSLGVSYWRENANQKYWFSPNEQNMFHLFFDPTYLVTPQGQPVTVPALPDYPQLGQLAGTPLPDSHQEENYNKANNQAYEAFFNGTYQLTRKLFVSAGVRGIFDSYKLSGESNFSGGSESVLGMLTGNYPNLFFKPGILPELSKKTLSFTGKVGVKYEFSSTANVFINASRGRRPNVLQYTSAGEKEILDAEIINNLDGGFKLAVADRVLIDVVGFYQLYRNFQTRAWVADTQSGEFNYKVKDGGKATSFGAEANVKIAINKQIDFFGNYAWLHATFDSTDVDGLTQEYAGNVFSLAPEHSFTVGFNARFDIAPTLAFFVTPTYSYKTHLFFEDANTPGLEQNAYGLFNINGGIELKDPNLILSVWARNLLDEHFVTSAGNTGSLFGVPTFVPGSPRMFGSKLTWKF